MRSIIKGRLGATLFELIKPAKLQSNYIYLITSIFKISLTGFWGNVLNTLNHEYVDKLVQHANEMRNTTTDQAQ